MMKHLWQLLHEKAAQLRREAVRSLASFSLTAPQVATILTPMVEDENPMIRSEILRTLAAIDRADNNTISLLVKACKPAMPGNTLGGVYERNFERYLALKALEQYPEALYAYFQSGDASAQPVSNLLWAAQALPEEQKKEKILVGDSNIQVLDELHVWLSKLDPTHEYPRQKMVITTYSHLAAYSTSRNYNRRVDCNVIITC